LGSPLAFFIVSLGAAGYFFYFGGNAVSADKITIDIQGPTTVAAGDTVPLSISITNRNSVAIDSATIEFTFPAGTRSGDGKLSDYPRYTEDLGEIASGETVTRSVRAVVFGGAGQALLLPVSFSYGTAGSNSVFVKKSSYALAISSTPLSVSIESLSETVSGQPLTFAITVRSNATVPIQNVVLSAISPFGFSVTNSTLPMNGSTFLIGTLAPGESKTVSLTGTLIGQGGEQRIFRFTVGTGKSASDATVEVAYMTQDASVLIASPFIATTIALNGDIRPDIVITPGSYQNVTVSYINTLATSVSNAVVTVAISGTAVDYNSIQTSSGFYRSADRTIVFSRDTDPSLAMLAPGASGIGSFTFSTLSSGAIKTTPTVTLAVSVSGTRVGQSSVPELVSSSFVRTVKVATSMSLTATALQKSGPFIGSGPVPPLVGQATTYNIIWNVRNSGSSVADGVVSAILPSYVSYTNLAIGAGTFSYDSNSRTVSWNVGDIAQGASAQGTFQVSLLPSSSQIGTAPVLTSPPTFSGHDRFAGVQVNASALAPTTDTKGDTGYMTTNAFVQ